MTLADGFGVDATRGRDWRGSGPCAEWQRLHATACICFVVGTRFHQLLWRASRNSRPSKGGELHHRSDRRKADATGLTFHYGGELRFAAITRMPHDHILLSLDGGATKSAILDFVARVTAEGGPDYVSPSLRIATFDNDRAPWCEQPLQNQFFFAFHQPEALADRDPSCASVSPTTPSLSGTSRPSTPWANMWHPSSP
jgi:hypothetical protein